MIELVDTLDLDIIERILASLGCTLEQEQAHAGTYRLEETSFQMGVVVLLFGGDQGFDMLYLKTGWQLPLHIDQEHQALQIINRWNNDQWVGRASLTKELAVELDLTFEVKGGVTEEALRTFIITFHRTCARFYYTSARRLHGLKRLDDSN